MTVLADAPLRGRRFHMMGVGGAGVSALAQLAAAWGADVSGCDPAASRYADLVRAAGVEVQPGHDPAHVHPGQELVLSSAVPADHPERARAAQLGVPEQLRGELLGELSALRDGVIVAGAHGKSTTTAMIAHAAVAVGLDPTVVVGGIVDSIGGNVRIGSSRWMVVEGDESDRTLRHLRGRIAVVTNIERDHHHTYATDEELFALFAAWVGGLGPDSVLIAGPGAVLDRLAYGAPQTTIVRFGHDEAELSRVGRLLSQPGRHNALNAQAALAAIGAMGGDVGAAESALGGFDGVARRFQRIGIAGGHAVVDDYAHHPTEVAAAIQGAREEWPGRGLTVIFQPHLYSRTQELAHQFAAALAGADRVLLLPIYGARESPVAGVTSELIAEPLRRTIGDRVTTLVEPVATTDVARLAGSIMEGDAVITMGAGDVTALAAPLVVAFAGADVPAADADSVPAWITADADLSRFTTIGTGGRARWLAAPETDQQLQQTLTWAAARDLPVAAIGLGSNTLVDDTGFDGVALRLSGDLARIEIDAEAGIVTAGGGASLAAIVRLCRDAGLARFEFACAIPGTIGGAVRMNAGAYGSEMVDVLDHVTLVDAEGIRTAPATQLGLRYRGSDVRLDEVVGSAVLHLSHDDPAAIKERVKAMQARRTDTQPRAARSFGSVFQNPTVDRSGNPAPGGAGFLVERAGLKGHTVGGARISPKHGNFIENADGATTADVLELIRLAQASVLRDADVVLHTEVHVLGGRGYRSVEYGEGGSAS